MNGFMNIGFINWIFILQHCSLFGWTSALQPFNNNAINTVSQHERSQTDNFVHLSVLVCRAQMRTVQCPYRMHIKPGLVTQLNTWPNRMDNIAACTSPNSEGETFSANRHTLPSDDCLESNVETKIRLLCEGRDMCQLDADDLIQNRTDCEASNLPIRFEYQCLPDPDTVLFEAICADTYMDVKCDGQRSGQQHHTSLVILTARLDRAIDPIGHKHPGCPNLQQQQQQINNRVCTDRLDVTEEIQSICKGQSSCSVNPNFAGKFDQACGKMHLSLKYVCVPSTVITTTLFEDSNKKSKSQRQNKGLQHPKSTSNIPIHSFGANESNARGTRQLPALGHGSSMEKNPEPPHGKFVAPASQKASTSSKPFSLSIGMVQPLFIGLGIGFAMLLLLLGVGLLICQRRKRGLVEKRHSYSDPMDGRMPLCVRGSQIKTNDAHFHCCSCDPSRNPVSKNANVMHVEKCCCNEMNLMHESFHPYRHVPNNVSGAVSFASGITEMESPGLYNTEHASPNMQQIPNQQTSPFDVAFRSSPSAYVPTFPILNAPLNRNEPTVIRGSSAADSCSGRGCDGGSGASDPCELAHNGFRPLIPYTYSGLPRPNEFNDAYIGQLPPSASQQEIYPYPSENMHYMTHKTRENFDECNPSTLNRRSFQSDRDKLNAKCAPELNDGIVNFQETELHVTKNRLLNGFPALPYSSRNMTQNEPPKRMENQYRQLAQSNESFTEPLIEPPSDFRNSMRVAYSKRFPPSKHDSESNSTGDNGLNRQNVNLPPDLILKNGNFLTHDVNQNLIDAENIPLPPPPLRVFGASVLPHNKHQNDTATFSVHNY